MRVRRTRGERGAAVMEFALVFPIVVMIVFGIIQYGIHFWSMNTASAVARESARLMLVNSDFNGCVKPWAVKQAAMPSLGPVSVTLTNSSTGAALDPVAMLPEGTPIRITVSFDSLDLGMGMIPGSRVSQSADAVVQYEPKAYLAAAVTRPPCPAEYQ